MKIMICKGKERRNAISYKPQIPTPSESPKDSGDESAKSDLTNQPPNATPYPSPPMPSPFNGLVPGHKGGSSRSKLPTTRRKSAPSPPLRDIQIASQFRLPSDRQSTKPHQKKKKTEKNSGLTVLQSIPERKEESSSGSDTVYMEEARSTQRRKGIAAEKREKGQTEAIELDYFDTPGASCPSGLASTMRKGEDTQYGTEDETERMPSLTCTRN